MTEQELVDCLERDYRADIDSDHLTWVETYCLERLDHPEPRGRELGSIGRTLGVGEDVVEAAIESARRKLTDGTPAGRPSRERHLRQQSNQMRWARMIHEEIERRRREGLLA